MISGYIMGIMMHAMLVGNCYAFQKIINDHLESFAIPFLRMKKLYEAENCRLLT